jgi:hypothetical protein
LIAQPGNAIANKIPYTVLFLTACIVTCNVRDIRPA